MPESSVMVAASSTCASALPRSTSAMTYGSCPACMICWAKSCGETGALRAADELVGEVLLLDGDVQLIRQRVQDELRLHRPHGAVADLGGELLPGLPSVSR